MDQCFIFMLNFNISMKLSNYSVHHLALPRAKREITFFIPPLQIHLKVVTFAGGK